MKLKFKDVLPNPWRDLKGNPLKPDKVNELVSSINTTGFWDNVVVRKNKAGKYELAYGHHRVAAAIKAGLIEADFIVKDLTDALMIQIMDNENREIYASSPASMIESVKAVVSALAEGIIGPFKLHPMATRMGQIRYAPSYIPAAKLPASGKPETDESKAYTSLQIAEFLGRIYSYPEATIRAGGSTGGTKAAAEAVLAALNFLQLQELGKINASILINEGKPISSTKLLTITTDLKQRHEREVVRREKTAAEIAEYNEQQRLLKAKLKADAEVAEVERRATLQKIADAKRKEQEDKADALKAKQKENDERAKAKDALNKQRIKELDEKIAQKKAWESEQRVIDAYMPIRRDVEALISRWEKKVSERDDEREQVKALAKLRDLRPEDRLRLRKAAVAVADHYNEWIAPQFAPLPTVKEELKTMAKREVAKRKSEKEKV
jgi:hypothetical protein